VRDAREGAAEEGGERRQHDDRPIDRMERALGLNAV
jgi:hypothetical protein